MELLGELLLKRGACDEDSVQAALENQAIYGGRLGTNLLEMGAISEEALAEALGEKYGVPHISGEVEMDVDAVGLVPKDLADRFDVVPFVASHRRLGLLCIDPTDMKVADELAFATGRQVHPIVVPEARLWKLLRQTYQIERRRGAQLMQFPTPQGFTADGRESLPEVSYSPAALPEDMSPVAPQGGVVDLSEILESSKDEDLMPEAFFMSEVAAPVPSPKLPDLELPPRVEKAPPGRWGAVELPRFTQNLLAGIAARAGSSHGGAKTSPFPPRRLTPQPEPVVTGLRGALSVLELACDQDSIATALLRYAGSRFRRALLFVAEEGALRAWDSASQGLHASNAFELPVDSPGILSTAARRGEPVASPLLHSESDVRLVDRLGGGAPNVGVAVPVVALGRVVNVLYADEGPGSFVRPGAMKDLEAVAAFAARRYEALLNGF